MNTIVEIMAQAVARHQAGELGKAAVLYRRVLVEQPGEGNALHLLGIAAASGDQDPHSVVMIRRSLRVQPDLAVAGRNLALRLQRQGVLDETEAMLRHWLGFEPTAAEALEWLGGLMLAEGRLDEAEALLRRAERMGGSDRLGLALARCALYKRIVEASKDPALPPGIVVRGVFRDSSGYAYQVRQFVRYLVAAGVRVHLIDLLHAPTDNLSVEQIDPLLLTLNQPVRAKAVLSFTTPLAVEKLPGLMTVNYSLFEATRIPDPWARHSLRHDHILVATESSRDAWVEAGCPPERITLCPEGVEAVAEDQINPINMASINGRQLSDYRVRFLNISDFNPRKNLTGLLRVWLRATHAQDDAALVLKIGKGSGIAQNVTATAHAVSEEIGVPLGKAAGIFLVDGKYSDAEMLSLFASCTHYWSMSHGEGWDLPMAQAGAMGLTLLAPRHSAYTAYLDDKVAHMLQCQVVDAFGAYKGLRWWAPDEAAAADLLGRIIRDPLAHRRSARERLRAEFGWDKAARVLIDRLTAIGAL